ncbi:MAG: ATPase [Prevotella sp.]|nr:ATPase [Prevotella sp.]
MGNEKYTLIADSGSTKTDWALVNSSEKQALRASTQGLNPIHLTDEAFVRVLREELCQQLPSQTGPINAVCFYGSGVTPEQEGRVVALLRSVFSDAGEVEAHSDMLGAARALCGNDEGLACILGTGANSCLYDGARIVRNTPALGYILGDEGSGAVLGRLFLNAVYKYNMYAGAKEEFEQHTGLSMADVIDRVYRQPMANRWLASLSPYIHQHLFHPEVEQLVVANFRSFIQRNIVPYGRADLPLNALGSIAWHYREQLAVAAKEEGYAVGKILRSPLDALVQMEQLG